jgi:ankyrin repeat protein
MFRNFAIFLLFFCLNDFYLSFKDGNTPLLIAIKKGYKAVAKTMLDKGVDANATNKVSMQIIMMS